MTKLNNIHHKESYTLGDALITVLEKKNVKVIFGIPGVHTIELYKSLEKSSIRHVTPRHEQSAGFMADGYARVTGLPGVCLVITGPGVTNILTAMAQARADSVPMLIISTVNPISTFGKGFGLLHELPNQNKLMSEIALNSETIETSDQIIPAIERAFLKMTEGRPGPVHIEIPTNLLSKEVSKLRPEKSPNSVKAVPFIYENEVIEIVRLLRTAKNPIIILGGGAIKAQTQIREMVNLINAPFISTINARGIIGRHPLSVPASPTLKPIHDALEDSDLVLAIGTEFGQTDYDLNNELGLPKFKKLIRVDICKTNITSVPSSYMNLCTDSQLFCKTLIKKLKKYRHTSSDINNAINKAKTLNKNAVDSIEPKLLPALHLINQITEFASDIIVVGDSTQPIYAGNLFCEISRPTGWFNSATGYGTLGYALPASIGAKLGSLKSKVVCLIGDGGIQFTLSELGTAIDENIAIVFIIWNNHGYKEIADFMKQKNITPIGVNISPPKFDLIAKAYGITYINPKNRTDFKDIFIESLNSETAVMIEILEKNY